jgi:uncharacterized protein
MDYLFEKSATFENMEQESKILITKTAEFVKKELHGAEGGHDWWHIQRVWNLAKKINENENGNWLVVELGSILHDVADYKFHGGDEERGPAVAKCFLRSLKIDGEIIDHICQIISNISFKGGNEIRQFRSLELDIIQDADRLDAMGAIGIARAFNYGGYKGRELYNPDILPVLNMTKEQYKTNSAPTINHFYEKLLLLKDLMNTPTGKAMALRRHHFMESFLKEFFNELEI